MRYSYQSSENTPVWIIIGINIIIFILEYIVPSLEVNLGLQLFSFSQHPWTIITSIFVHAGFFHILANMITLFFFGTFLVQLIGTSRFLIVYFVSGIVGNLVFLLFAYLGIAANPYTFVVGASGAIFGLGGTLVVLVPKLRVYIYGLLPVPLWIAVIGGFFIIAFVPYVAWQAHLGGLVTGVIAGLYFRREAGRYRLR